MKIQREQIIRRRSNGGMATIIFIALLAIMLVLILSNARTVLHLRILERVVEQRQIERLNASQTNVTAVAESPAKPEPK